jgi:hypothetical protein
MLDSPSPSFHFNTSSGRLVKLPYPPLFRLPLLSPRDSLIIAPRAQSNPSIPTRRVRIPSKLGMLRLHTYTRLLRFVHLRPSLSFSLSPSFTTMTLVDPLSTSLM